MACQQVTTGYKCENNQVLTISSPYDASNPLVSHVWTIDGAQESTAAQFQKTYAEAGFHTIVHSGSNLCGSPCSQSIQLEISEVIIPPPPPQPAAAAPPGISPLVVAAVVVLGFLGIVMVKKK